MAACLSMVPVPSAIIDLVRKIKQVNKKGGDFYIDFEFVSLPRPRKEGKVAAERIPVEIAVLRLDDKLSLILPSSIASQFQNYWLVFLVPDPRRISHGALCGVPMVKKKRRGGRPGTKSGRY